MKHDAFRFLSAAREYSETKREVLIPTRVIAAQCGMDDFRADQVMTYLEDRGYISGVMRALGEPYPVAFQISSDGHDWLDA